MREQTFGFLALIFTAYPERWPSCKPQTPHWPFHPVDAPQYHSQQHLVQKMLVVAYQENTSVELLQRFDERIGRLKIKTVGGF